MKIPTQIRKIIEGELINYPSNKKALAYAKQNVYLKHSPDGYVTLTQGKNFSSPVEQKVLHLMSDHNIMRLEYSISAIEDTLSDLREEHRRLIELRYFKSYSVERVVGELSICARNFFRWRDKAIACFAIRFGLI
ncbi:MAG TPA: hypothetical protein DEA44_15330 [Firmicutes bacterium]|nr:hypothetical protein [Bacillota bacterium]